MKANASFFIGILFSIMIFNGCSVAKENKKMIQRNKLMWEMVSNYDFDIDKMVYKMDSIYIKTFDSDVKYEISEIDCCYNEEKAMTITTSALDKNESIIFYFDRKLQIIGFVHELPPMY